MRLDRRRTLAALALPAAVPVALAGCAGGMANASYAEPPAFRRLAGDVWWCPGAPGLPTAGNRARVANAGLIAGPAGALLIETGASVRHGQALLEAAARATDRPLRLALITHAQQEFIFGSNAMRARGIPVAMHEAASRLMLLRCDNCLKNLTALLGETEMADSAVVRPEQTLAAPGPLDVVGRPLQLLYFGHSSGPGDVAVWDATHGVLFAGGLVDAQHIPDLQDGELPAWRAALTQLATLPGLRVVVPGHGPAGGPELITGQLAYFNALESRVAALLKDGVALAEVIGRVDLPAWRDWAGYDTLHRRNVSVLYLRLEQALLFGS